MADTWRENAIVLAILIIADKKIAQAGYDKTIKGIINKVLDKTKGKYQIKYQDSLFEAFSTSAKVLYVKDQLVSVLIPGNDWDRIKTILGGVDIKATNYQQVPIVSLNYNKIGTSGTSLKKNIELSSYVGDTGTVIDLVNQGYITLNNTNNFINYVKKGNGIALGMKVRTALADGQIGGDYGLRFYLKFNDNVNKTEVIKPFEVNIKDVIGHPYLLTSDTIVETLIKDIDILNFKGIDSIQAYCIGFPENIDKINIKDIFISDVFINGASVLSDLDLNGYVLHIDYSEKGNIIEKNSTASIPFAAQLKVDGKITTLDVKYYWFRLNATVFKGDKGKYSGYAGDGWECLNYYTGDSFVAKTNNIFYFKNGQPNSNAEKTDIQKNNTAYAPQKVTKILCVAVYDNKNWITGLALVINNNASDITIATKQVILTYDLGDKKWVEGNLDNPVKTIYYLDNGTPTLICNTDLTGSGISYTWSVKPARGSAISKTANSTDNNNYNTYKSAYKFQIDKANGMAKSSKDSYIKTSTYTTAINNWNNIKNKERINANIYYNFPIKSISEYSTVSCAVTQNGVYKGTASIVLYNKTELEGMYSLNLENGTQVFQYDGKGNSPASPQREKPILITPLTFTLIDNEGKEISHLQIKNNGNIKWIIPNTQTLLKSNGNGDPDSGGGATDLTVTRATLPLLAKYYDVYSNKDSFNYTIENQYDAKKDINYIWLYVKYKDMLFNAYTNFTFPKDGDPGTNGTDYVAKIVPSKNTDRVYISSKATSTMFNDDGATIDKLEYVLYNNSLATSSGAHYWTAPPKVNTIKGEDIGKTRKTFLSVTPQDLSNNTYKSAKISLSVPSDLTFDNIVNKAPINIVRAQYGTGSGQGNIHYFAEIPICTEYINGNYRLKIKPKTGYSYVVYSSDGTSANYDNSLPFEIIVEKLIDNYYTTNTNLTYTYQWGVIGNLNNNTNNANKTYSVSPKTTFDGRNLTSAVICQVKKGNDLIGFIHIPIYMIINRYNNRALNAWDGNSVQIDKNGNGLILTPQIAAGAKDDDNAFTGMLMGQIALNTSDANIGKNGDVGIMGYDSGVRTIFLDAKTGKAEFGKNNQGKIIIDPDTKINEQASALLYSNTFNKDKYVTAANAGNPASTVHNIYNSGLMIDLTSPTIQFGSGRFYVDKNGNIHASGDGDIAGWRISDDAFYKHDGTNKTGMRSNGDPAFYAGTNAQSTISPGTTGAYNFFVNHNGYLYSKSGKIASWNININNISNGNVGMGNSHTTAAKTFHNQSKDITNGRIWSGNGSNDTFLVTADGKLYSKSGQIANWSIGESMLTDGNIGMGQYTFDSTNPFINDQIYARIWGGQDGSGKTSYFRTNNTNGTISFNPKLLNFAVSTDGSLYSKKGKIGGWNIDVDKLWAGNSKPSQEGIRINDNGSLDGKNWSITRDGNAYFKNIWGNVQAVKSDGTKDTSTVYYLTGGDITTTSAGGCSENGPGYRLGSDGTMYVGGGSGSMNFDGSNLTVKGIIKADGGYLGNDNTGWKIDSTGIINASGSVTIYPNAITYGDGTNSTKITAAKVESTRILTKGGTDGGFWAFGNKGRTGTITFSLGTVLYIKAGIITGATKGLDSTINWTDR